MMNPKPSNLPRVLAEISDALGKGDWTRYSDESGRFYYVIREADHNHEVQDGRAFREMHWLEIEEPDAFGDWYFRAALASATPNYLERAVKAGVDPALCNAVAAALSAPEADGAVRSVLENWLPRLTGEGRWEDIAAVCGVIRIARTQSSNPPLTSSQRLELQRVFEVRILGEFSGRYQQMVKRAMAFDWLSVADPQLQEASRCYVQGFYRAAVLIATAAVETQLRVVAESSATNPQLVQAVYGPLGRRSDPVRCTALLDMFAKRNAIAHRNADLDQDGARAVIDTARAAVEDLNTLRP